MTPTYQVLGLYAFYIVVCFVAYLLLSGRRRFENPSSIWFKRRG
jgi:hypothetical protein